MCHTLFSEVTSPFKLKVSADAITDMPPCGQHGCDASWAVWARFICVMYRYCRPTWPNPRLQQQQARNSADKQHTSPIGYSGIVYH